MSAEIRATLPSLWTGPEAADHPAGRIGWRQRTGRSRHDSPRLHQGLDRLAEVAVFLVGNAHRPGELADLLRLIAVGEAGGGQSDPRSAPLSRRFLSGISSQTNLETASAGLSATTNLRLPVRLSPHATSTFGLRRASIAVYCPSLCSENVNDFSAQHTRHAQHADLVTSLQTTTCAQVRVRARVAIFTAITLITRRRWPTCVNPDRRLNPAGSSPLDRPGFMEGRLFCPVTGSGAGCASSCCFRVTWFLP
jgi:hypothetical protein